MSDNGFDDDFDDGFGFYDDLDYQEDDDLVINPFHPPAPSSTFTPPSPRAPPTIRHTSDSLEFQSALVDSMAETAFAQGEPIWDEFDAEYDMADYHSDWSYYSDGGFFSDEEPEEEGKKKSTAGRMMGTGGVVGGSGSGGTGEKTTAAKVSGRPARKRRRLMVVDESEKGALESTSTPGKVTSTVIVPSVTTPVKKKPTKLEGKANEVDKKIGPNKDSPVKTSSGTDVATIRASMKRKPSTDEVPVSP